MKWAVPKLEEIVSIKTGKLDSNAAVPNGQYPFLHVTLKHWQLTHMHMTQKLYYSQATTQAATILPNIIMVSLMLINALTSSSPLTRESLTFIIFYMH